jgi:hypothetical protein
LTPINTLPFARRIGAPRGPPPTRSAPLGAATAVRVPETTRFVAMRTPRQLRGGLAA